MQAYRIPARTTWIRVGVPVTPLAEVILWRGQEIRLRVLVSRRMRCHPGYGKQKGGAILPRVAEA